MDQKTAVKQFKAIKKYSDKTTMRLAAQHWEKEWQTLFAIMMSAQTRDEVTIEIAKKLFLQFPDINHLSKANPNDIEKIIKPVNYHKTKAKHLIACAKIIADEGLNHDIDSLTSLPGVGRKTANVFLAEIEGKDAIGVDTHVFRISHKMNWVTGKTPDKVEMELMALFPKKIWNQINDVLVRFGKGYGTSRNQEDKILTSIKVKLKSIDYLNLSEK